MTDEHYIEVCEFGIAHTSCPCPREHPERLITCNYPIYHRRLTMSRQLWPGDALQ